MNHLRFTSAEFQPLPGEVEKVNPGRFGEALANWVQAKLATEGYKIEEHPIPEDWGWVLMLQRKPFPLWIGCGNEDGDLSRWRLFVEAEIGLFQKLFKKIDPAPEISALEKQLEKLVNEAGFKDIEWERS